MGYLSEKIAYIKGLCDGLDIEGEKTGRVLSAVIEALEEAAGEIEELSAHQRGIADRLEDVEDELDDMICGGDFTDIGDWDGEEEEYSFQCPDCGEMVYFDPEMLESDEEYIVCPNCKKKIELEFDCDEGIDCSDCGGCGDEE